MNIYLLTHGRQNENTMTVRVFFFERSAMAAAARYQQDCGGEWNSVDSGGTRAIASWQTPALWMSVSKFPVLFRNWSLRRWIRDRCHWQNLNTDKNDKPKGSILRHGRAWFRPFGYGHKRARLETRWEWMFWTHFWALQFDVGAGDGNDGLSLWVACGLFSFHFTVDRILPRRFVEWGRQKALKTEYLGYEYMAWPRSTGVRIFEKTIWFEIWNWDFGWDRRQPKWLSFNWAPLNTLLGEPVYTSRALPEFRVGEELFPKKRGVLMPEGVYPVEITLTEDKWKRPRWPWPTVVRRARIECPGGIPTPGKGENSWDCGEDATYGLTCPASTVEEAVEELKRGVMEDRERYGGKNWLPERVRGTVSAQGLAR